MTTSTQDSHTANYWSTKRILAEIKAQRGERVANHFQTPITRLLNNLDCSKQDASVKFLDISVPVSAYTLIRKPGFSSKAIHPDEAKKVVDAAVRNHDQEKAFNDTWAGMVELAEALNISPSSAEHILNRLRRQYEEEPPRDTLSHGRITIPRTSFIVHKTKQGKSRVMIRREEITGLGNEITALDGTTPVTVNLNPKSENGIGKPR